MMDLALLREACLSLGMEEPISIEPDGTVWTGSDDDRLYPKMAPILKEAEAITARRAALRASVLAKLEALGFSVEEIAELWRIA
jgi:hypothetical protein